MARGAVIALERVAAEQLEGLSLVTLELLDKLGLLACIERGHIVAIELSAEVVDGCQTVAIAVAMPAVVARKLAVILHKMWINGQDFEWKSVPKEELEATQAS